MCFCSLGEGGNSPSPAAVWGMDMARGGANLPLFRVSVYAKEIFFLFCFHFAFFLIASKEWKISAVADSKYRKAHLHIDVSACNCIIP